MTGYTALLPVAALAGATPFVLLHPTNPTALAMGLGGACSLLALGFSIEWCRGEFSGRPRRAAAYAVALWGGTYLVLAAIYGPFFGPLLVRMVGFPVAALGWLPVAWWSLAGNQPHVRAGRATPFLFSALWACFVGIMAWGY